MPKQDPKHFLVTRQISPEDAHILRDFLSIEPALTENRQAQPYSKLLSASGNLIRFWIMYGGWKATARWTEDVGRYQVFGPLRETPLTSYNLYFDKEGLERYVQQVRSDLEETAQAIERMAWAVYRTTDNP